MAIIDHKYEEENDNGLVIENGDFAIVESEQYHIIDIINSGKGEWRQDALVGVGSLDFLNNTLNIDILKKRIKLQLEYDNFNVNKIAREPNGELRIIARQNEIA